MSSNNSAETAFKNTLGVNTPEAPKPEDTRQNVAGRKKPPVKKSARAPRRSAVSSRRCSSSIPRRFRS